MAPSYALLLAAFMIAGAGNSVFHPADMAILNARIEPTRLGYAFSLHAVSGNLGWVPAPLFSVAIATAFGWRTAVIAAGVSGLAIALLLAFQPVLRTESQVTAPGESDRRRDGGALRGNLRLLLSVPVLTCFSFFVFSSMTTVALGVVNAQGLDATIAELCA